MRYSTGGFELCDIVLFSRPLTIITKTKGSSLVLVAKLASEYHE